MARIALFSVVVLLMSSASALAQNTLAGKWMFLVYEFDGRSVEEYTQAALPAGPQAEAQRAENEARLNQVRAQTRQSYIEFKADGTFASFFQSEASTGTWRYDPEHSVLTLIEDRPIPFQAQFLANGNLEMQARIDMDGRSVPVRLVMERVR